MVASLMSSENNLSHWIWTSAILHFSLTPFLGARANPIWKIRHCTKISASFNEMIVCAWLKVLKRSAVSV